MAGESDHAASINHERSGNPRNAILLRNGRCSLYGDHLMERVVVEITHRIFRTAIKVDPDEDKSVSRMIHGDLMQMWEGLTTRGTPRRPEVEKHDLPAIRGK